MKIAIILGQYSVGARPLNFYENNIWISTRGLTGTDLSAIMISKELYNLNHDVHLFTVYCVPSADNFKWDGVNVYKFEQRFEKIDDSFDCVISINEPDSLRNLNNKAVKICWQFLNDFTYCQPGFDDAVDHWVAVCDFHKNYLLSHHNSPDADKWSVVPLGCDPSWYHDNRISGRVIWCSSADRGLHNLLQEWPKIKAAIPHATLKIFYHFEYGNVLSIEPNSQFHHPHPVEMAQRLRYILESIERLKHLGVEHVKSVSREQMKKEMSEASVFAFPCDTVSMTEGFSISSMEAHASFTVPVMTDVDCLGSIYNDSGAIIIKSPVRDRLPKFSDAVIKALIDKEFADAIIGKCRIFAEQYSWTNIAKQMENVINLQIGKKNG